MKNEVSIFIMDVSNSSKEDIGMELSEYLKELQISIAYWTQYIVPTKVTHRAGDELVIVSSGYASSYILAFYLSRIWKYTDHRPYFGLSFGNVEEDLSSINIETWIHPLMKQARLANDFLKKQQDRMQFRFVLPHSHATNGFEVYSSEFEKLLNTILSLKQLQINEQTEIQSLVCSLYLILGQQNKVSKYLDRTKSTISSHMKNGKTDVILDAFHDIIKVLTSLETQPNDHRVNELQTTIRQNVNNRLQNYLPAGRRAE
ncbi:hypothetical protein [Oceanobacillus sp. FSL H7-0719]|uniref:hypothetical protein n=1 Tax=Oceanobacillus sp. FSL H7-0719 TaxID=2954507 RepID=UPI00324AE1AF